MQAGRDRRDVAAGDVDRAQGGPHARRRAGASDRAGRAVELHLADRQERRRTPCGRGPGTTTPAAAARRRRSRCRGGPGSADVLHTTRNRSASPASDTHALRPVTRQPSPSGSARVVIAVASEPACGSVSENPPRASPAASGSRPALGRAPASAGHGGRDRVVHREREGEGGVAAAELLEHRHPLRVGERRAADRCRAEEPGQPRRRDHGAGVARRPVPSPRPPGSTCSRANAAAGLAWRRIISAGLPVRPPAA